MQRHIDKTLIFMLFDHSNIKEKIPNNQIFRDDTKKKSSFRRYNIDLCDEIENQRKYYLIVLEMNIYIYQGVSKNFFFAGYPLESKFSMREGPRLYGRSSAVTPARAPGPEYGHFRCFWKCLSIIFLRSNVIG